MTNAHKPPPAQNQSGDGESADYDLRLYFAGVSPLSIRAVTNIKKICEQYLPGHYTLEVIDLYQQPQLAARDQIIATPILIRQLPRPVQRIIGDLSDTQVVMQALNLPIPN